MATEVGNIHIGLYVDVGESRRFTDVANLVERDARRMNTALGSTTRSVAMLRTGLNQNLRLRLASESLRDLSRATGEVERLRAAMLGISALAGVGITGAFTGAYLIQTADKARLLGNQIRTVTKDTAEFGAVQDELFKISQRTRSSLESTTQIYARTARATETLGMSQDKVLRLTETVQKAFAIGGATPGEATGAALQLSQGIASDRFGGEEFRSVAENAPVLLKGIADSLDVDIGKLRKMSVEGKLTAAVVTEAIIKSAAKIDEAFAKMTPTVAQSFTMLDNTFIRYIGQSDETYGVTKKLSAGLVSLSDNFEEVMWWITRVTAGLGALYVARKVTLAGQSMVGGIQTTNASIRKEIGERLEINKAIGQRLAEIRTAETAANATIDEGKNQSLLKQYETQKRIRDLETARAGVVDKLGIAQNASIGKLQKEVEIARQRVRDDQLRVIQAQEAAAAEERVLRARLAQRVGVADQNIVTANGRVFETLGRVGETKAAITAEKELAKTRIATEIETRRQSLVTNTQRLMQTQSQIAELRSVRDLPDFEQAFGPQYRRLLQDQQKVIISTGNIRKELDGLGQKMADIDSGAASTRGITTAMTKHAAAVKQAEAAIMSLAKAEATRDKIASADVGGKTMQARLASEAKEIERYQKSIDNLQSKMADLRTATTEAFTGTGARRMVLDIDALDKKILAAQTNLQAASAAVSAAQAGNGETLNASLEAQSRAAREVNDLQSEAAALIERQTVNTNRLAVAQKRLNILRRAGSNVLGFFGGVTGTIITGALVTASVLMAKFAADAAESAEQTARIRKQLEDMGYLTAAAATAMAQFKTDVAEGRVSKLREEIKDFQKEMTKAIDQLNDLDISGQAAAATQKPFVPPEGVTNQFDIDKAFSEWKRASRSAAAPITSDLQRIRDEMIKNKGMSDEVRKSLEDMALANPELSSISLSLINLGELMNSLKKASDDWLDSIRQMRRGLPEKFRQSENDSMTNLDKMNAANSVQLAQTVKESAWTEYEAHVHSIMDKLIKDAEKLGNVLGPALARQNAEQIIANETAKKGLLDLIGLFEGTDKGRGYNETLGYGKFTGGDVNLTTMTLREILDLQKKMLANPENTFNSSAVGRYQITAQTLKDFMGRMNLSMDDVFSPEIQDRIANEIIRSTGGDLDKLRGRWEGFLKASDQQLKTASGETFPNLPRMDESAQKWLDGIKDLDLKAKIQALNEFDQGVVQTAQSMGASKESVDQYIAAMTSGDLSKIPPIFAEITKRLKEGVDNGFNRQLQDFKFANTVELLTDIDQKVVETARAFGIGEDAIRQYVAALKGGNLEDIPEKFKAIREEAARMSEIALTKDVLSGALTDIRGALEDGKISWEEWGDIATNMLNKVADKLQDMFLNSILSDTGFNLFAGLLGGGGSMFPSKPGGLYDEGGYTGPGGKKKPAGIVHAGEYVFDAESTRRMGVKNLRLLHEMLKSGRAFGPSVSPPDMEGARYTRMRMPQYPETGLGHSALGGLAEAVLASNRGSRDGISVVVNNNSSASVRTEESQDERGGRRVDFILEDKVASATTRPGSSASRALRNNYGLKQKLIRR